MAPHLRCRQVLAVLLLQGVVSVARCRVGRIQGAAAGSGGSGSSGGSSDEQNNSYLKPDVEGEGRGAEGEDGG